MWRAARDATLAKVDELNEAVAARGVEVKRLVDAAELRQENVKLHEDAGRAQVKFAWVYRENAGLREEREGLEARVGLLEELVAKEGLSGKAK